MFLEWINGSGHFKCSLLCFVDLLKKFAEQWIKIGNQVDGNVVDFPNASQRDLVEKVDLIERKCTAATLDQDSTSIRPM